VTEAKSEDHKDVEVKIWLRIAKERGCNVENLIGEEYGHLKEMAEYEQKQKFLEELDNNEFDDA